MRQLGKIFKKVRESRGLLQKDIICDELSKSHLSRFEKGETDLTISKFVRALEGLNLSIDEFFYIVNDFKRNDINDLLIEIQNCFLKDDMLNLKKLLLRQEEKVRKGKAKKFDLLNIILIKIKIKSLSNESDTCPYSEKDIKFLIDYLFSVEYWGMYELILFGNTVNVMPYKLCIVLAREMISRTEVYNEIASYRKLVASMTLNTYITCIEKDQLIDALYFEKKLHQFYFKETEIYERIVFQYAKGFYNYKKYQSNEAILEMKKSIGLFELVGSYHLAEQYKKHLQQLFY